MNHSYIPNSKPKKLLPVFILAIVSLSLYGILAFAHGIMTEHCLLSAFSAVILLLYSIKLYENKNSKLIFSSMSVIHALSLIPSGDLLTNLFKYIHEIDYLDKPYYKDDPYYDSLYETYQDLLVDSILEIVLFAFACTVVAFYIVLALKHYKGKATMTNHIVALSVGGVTALLNIIMFPSFYSFTVFAASGCFYTAIFLAESPLFVSKRATSQNFDTGINGIQI
ncbi:MAG: hypothetical protein IJW19_00620 [Clostridia bacterium]|nr:hypothetical protein [Clostridia bacterium]